MLTRLVKQYNKIKNTSVNSFQFITKNLSFETFAQHAKR